MKNDGIQLLEEIFPDAKIYQPLYKHGIYTIEDLLSCGSTISKVKGLGKVRQQELFTRMQELNLKFINTDKEM